MEPAILTFLFRTCTSPFLAKAKARLFNNQVTRQEHIPAALMVLACSQYLKGREGLIGLGLTSLPIEPLSGILALHLVDGVHLLETRAGSVDASAVRPTCPGVIPLRVAIGATAAELVIELPGPQVEATLDSNDVRVTSLLHQHASLDGAVESIGASDNDLGRLIGECLLNLVQELSVHALDKVACPRLAVPLRLAVDEGNVDGSRNLANGV
mmetsp:Transcript_11280/g.23548  ORF Transcript_11280/g.23548 Transcript_11280/m.23548 type:complete len:212 (+) Transcript_11280:236-871(+)